MLQTPAGRCRNTAKCSLFIEAKQKLLKKYLRIKQGQSLRSFPFFMQLNIKSFLYKQYIKSVLGHSLISYVCSSTQIHGLSKSAFDAYLFTDGLPKATTSLDNTDHGIADAEGRIDILVNCAGFGISGAVEFTDLSEAKRQMDVNFFGTVNVNKAVLPFMRKAGAGRIVNISSVAAVAHIPFQTYYSASKAAIVCCLFILFYAP